jgi:type IV secretory pathway TraG/TraD family ATPase VirD4
MALPGPRKNASGDIEEPGEMIIRVAGAAPIRGRQPLYFLDPVFLARARIPAPEDTDRIGVDVPNGEKRDFDPDKLPDPAGTAETPTPNMTPEEKPSAAAVDEPAG